MSGARAPLNHRVSHDALLLLVLTLFLLLQSALAPLEQVLPQEVPVGRQVGAFLLAGHHPGVPQHPHHIIGALQPAPVAHTSAG